MNSLSDQIAQAHQQDGLSRDTEATLQHIDLAFKSIQNTQAWLRKQGVTGGIPVIAPLEIQGGSATRAGQLRASVPYGGVEVDGLTFSFYTNSPELITGPQRSITLKTLGDAESHKEMAFMQGLTWTSVPDLEAHPAWLTWKRLHRAERVYEVLINVLTLSAILILLNGLAAMAVPLLVRFDQELHLAADRVLILVAVFVTIVALAALTVRWGRSVQQQRQTELYPALQSLNLNTTENL